MKVAKTDKSGGVNENDLKSGQKHWIIVFQETTLEKLHVIYSEEGLSCLFRQPT